MAKICNKEDCKYPVFGKGYCKIHQYFRNDTKNKLYKSASIKKGSSTNQKKCKATGELKLFKEIYEEVKGICQVTGRHIPFNVSNFSHVLSKGAYPSLRLYRPNIVHVHPDVHYHYDNSDKATTLGKYPNAEFMYELKDKLRYEYYNN